MKPLLLLNLKMHLALYFVTDGALGYKYRNAMTFVQEVEHALIIVV
jgi:hypothetical protein